MIQYTLVGGAADPPPKTFPQHKQRIMIRTLGFCRGGFSSRPEKGVLDALGRLVLVAMMSMSLCYD